MGAWGPGLFQDDLAQDVRDEYKDRLHRGKSGEEITKELMESYKYALADVDDAPVFWFALADTQWNMGRLENFVKEHALEHIEAGQDIKRWESEDPKGTKKRKLVLDALKEKLLSPQPLEKKVSQYRLYHCQWKIGDTYAYKIENNAEFCGRYLLVQKVDEDTWWPGHTVPTVYVKITKDESLPKSTEEYDRLEFIQTGSVGTSDPFILKSYTGVCDKSELKCEVDEFGCLPVYRINLLNTSAKVIPKSLIYLGNFDNVNAPAKELVPFSKNNIQSVSWKTKYGDFETKMLQCYLGHNQRGYATYKQSKTTDGVGNYLQ